METERPEQDLDFLGMPQPGQIAYGNISNSNTNFTTGDIVIDSSMVCQKKTENSVTGDH